MSFVAVGLAGGCSVYDSRYIFDPAPAEVASSGAGTADEQPARTLVSILGVRRPDKESDLPAGVDARDEEVALVPASRHRILLGYKVADALVN